MQLVIIIVNLYLFAVLIRSAYIICCGYLYSNPSLNKNAGNYKPLVSIVIPAWNEEVGITKTVDSILNSTYRKLDVIVVNDGSKDDTELIVKRIIRKNKNKVKLINKLNGGKASALNDGIKIAKSEIIVTVDADSYVYPDAIELLVRTLANPNYDAAIGTIRIGNLNSLVGLIQFFEYTFGFHTKKSQYLLNSIYVMPGPLSAFRKEVFNKIGLYESYSKTEDFDISLKLRKINGKIAYLNNAICVTEGASDLRSLLKQRTRWRHGGMMCLIHHRDIFFNKKLDKYFAFVEMPQILLVFVEILIYPMILVYMIAMLFTSNNYLSMLFFYMILPFVFVLLLEKELWKKPKLIPYLPFLPIFFNIISLIEFIGLIKSTKLIFQKRDVQWNNWVRVGV